MNFWSNASEMLWAGSVDMRSTFSRLFDSNTARLQLRGEKVKLSGNNIIRAKKKSLSDNSYYQLEAVTRGRG